MKKEEFKMDPVLLAESEKLYNKLILITVDKCPELAELIITFALKKVIEKNKYKDANELITDDFVDATILASSWLDYILGAKRH